MSGEAVTVRVDGAVCVGIGQCEAFEPDTFEVDDDGVAVVLGEGRLPRDRAEAAIERCPSGAISLG